MKKVKLFIATVLITIATLIAYALITYPGNLAYF